MIVRWKNLYALLLCGFVSCVGSLLNDYVALEVPLIYDNYLDTINIFRLNYSQLVNWRSITAEYANQRGIPIDSFVDGVLSRLQSKHYILNEDINEVYVDSHSSIHAMLKELNLLNEKSSLSNYFLSIKPESKINKAHSTVSLQHLLDVDKVFEQTIPDFLLKRSDIIIYQSLGVSTGGTTALNSLYKTLHQLGFKVLLCNDDNRFSSDCSRPSNNQLVVTGEWCHEVLDEYISSSGSQDTNDFVGRGLQYYLGFHHNNDACTGRVAIADSHFISKLIGRRQLSAYYLGCPMTSHFLEAYKDITIALKDADDNNIQHIKKENLIVIDPDYNRDYPPEQSMIFDLPVGYNMIYAHDIPAAQFPLLLQRAKITLDLGMPGPERLSGEAILSGTIAIVSERMNGASAVDFPGVTRVNPYNGSQITEVLARIAANYEEEIIKSHNIQFLQYMLSMQTKLSHTSNVMFLSSVIHFALTSHDLETEYTANFQILSLLYLYPLCQLICMFKMLSII